MPGLQRALGAVVARDLHLAACEQAAMAGDWRDTGALEECQDALRALADYCSLALLHGRDVEADILEFRDMVVILRDRIASLVAQGMTLQQVMATKPALDYDLRYDHAPGTSAKFVEAVYRDLKQRSGN